MRQHAAFSCVAFTAFAAFVTDARPQEDEGQLKWTFRPSSTLPCESSAAVGHNGRDIFVADAAELHKLDGRTGKPIWSRPAENDGGGSFSPSLTLRADTNQTVVVVPTTTALTAFDASTGALLWTAAAEDDRPFDGAASFSADGAVVFATGSWGGSAKGSIAAISTETGNVLWTFHVPPADPTQTGHTVWAKPLVWNDTAVIAGDFGGRLWALSTRTGRPLWHFQESQDPTGAFGNEIWAQVAVTPDDELIFASNLGWIRKFDPATGVELTDGHWPIEPARRANVSAAAALPLRSDPIVFSAPLVDADGTLYISSENWCVYAFRRDGTRKWANCDFCSWGTAGMVLRDDGTILFAADLPSPGHVSCPAWVAGCQPTGGLAGKEGHVISLNKSTGERLWAADIPGMNTFVCDEQMLNVLGDGTIVITGGTHGGGVFAFTGGSALDVSAPTPKYGFDPMLTGVRRWR